jgi:hypothetical protein
MKALGPVLGAERWKATGFADCHELVTAPTGDVATHRVAPNSGLDLEPHRHHHTTFLFAVCQGWSPTRKQSRMLSKSVAARIVGCSVL